MRFLLFICHDDAFIRLAQIQHEIQNWIDEMDARGIRLFGTELEPDRSALTITTVDEELVAMRGSFTDTRTQIIGYEVVEAVDEAEAIEIAAQHPMSTWGTIEIRAFAGE